MANELYTHATRSRKYVQTFYSNCVPLSPTYPHTHASPSPYTHCPLIPHPPLPSLPTHTPPPLPPFTPNTHPCPPFPTHNTDVPPQLRLQALQSVMLLIPDENREALLSLLTFLKEVSDHADINQVTTSILKPTF